MNNNSKEINISDKSLRIIPYIDFNALVIFECRNNFLTSLDIDLPNSLTYLDCSYNMIETLTKIPPNLEVLRCNNNSLFSIDKIPNTVEILNCSNNKLTELLITPFNNIKRLNCKYNKLTILPDLKKATKISCSYNLLTKFKNTSINLLYLHCANNLIKIILLKSNNIKYLNCSSNLLRKIQYYKNIEELICCYNNIKQIKLGKHLIILECCYNEFNVLPILPATLKYLKCVENPFNCFISPIIYNNNLQEIKYILVNHYKKINEFKEHARNLINYKLIAFKCGKDIDLMILSYFSCTYIKNINEGINFYKSLIKYMI
jgi:hypothetical protein